MSFTLEQFTKFWYFIVALALGFGIQIGLYTYLKNLVGQHGASGKVVATSGATSTAAMVSCCAHYLANILPIVGVTGFLTIVAQYQIELFWLGLAFNAAGILYIAPKVIQATKEHKKMLKQLLIIFTLAAGVIAIGNAAEAAWQNKPAMSGK